MLAIILNRIWMLTLPFAFAPILFFVLICPLSKSQAHAEQKESTSIEIIEFYFWNEVKIRTEAILEAPLDEINREVGSSKSTVYINDKLIPKMVLHQNGKHPFFEEKKDWPKTGVTTYIGYTGSGGAHCCADEYMFFKTKNKIVAQSISFEDYPYQFKDIHIRSGLTTAIMETTGFQFYLNQGFDKFPEMYRIIVFEENSFRLDRIGEFKKFYADAEKKYRKEFESLWKGDKIAAARDTALHIAFNMFMQGYKIKEVIQEYQKIARYDHLGSGFIFPIGDVADPRNPYLVCRDIQKRILAFKPIRTYAVVNTEKK